MAEEKVTQAQADPAEMRSPPAWYDGATAFDEALPGLPDFVSVHWIETWTSPVATHLRSLHNRFADKKSPRFAWWPKTRPMTNDFGYLIAMGLREPRDVAVIVREYVVYGEKPSERPGTIFRKLYDAPLEGNGAARLFVQLIEDPVVGRIKLQDYADGLPAHLAEDPSTVSVLAWARAAFPENAAIIDAIPGMGADRPEAVDKMVDAMDGTLPTNPAEGPAPPVAGTDPGALPAIGPQTQPGPGTATDPITTGSVMGVDPEVEAVALALRTAMVAARDEMDRCLASELLGRVALAPILNAVRLAWRQARLYDALQAAPVPILSILAVIEAVIARIEQVRPGKMPPWSAVTDGVRRSEVAGLAAAVSGLGDLAGRVEASVSTAKAYTLRMLEEGDFDLSEEIVRIKAGMAEDVENLVGAFGRLVALISDKQAEAAIRAAVRVRAAAEPVPAEAPLPIPVPVEAPSSATSRHSCSAVLRLDPGNSGFDGVVWACIEWMRGKVGSALGQDVDGRSFFDAESRNGTRGRGTPLPGAENRAWVGVFTEPDERSDDRTWRVDLCVGETGDGYVRVAVRASKLGSMGQGSCERRALPRLVRSLVEGFAAIDAGCPLSAEPRNLAGEAGARAYQALVFNAERKLPVLAVSSRDALSAATVEAVAHVLAGAAHVVTLDTAAARAVSARHGTGWSVTGGTARILPPGADPKAAGPGVKAMDRDLLRRLDVRQGKSSSFIPHVSEPLLKGTETLFSQNGITDFEAGFDQAAEAARIVADAAGEETGAIPHEFVERHREEVERLRRERDEGIALMASFDDDIRAIEAENLDAWTRNTSLARENERLRRLLAKENVSEPVPEPQTVEELCAFAETGLGPDIHVLERAIRETRAAQNLNVRLVHEGLAFLRDSYLPMRRREIGRAVYEEALKNCSLDLTPCFSDRGALHVFQGYTAIWRGRKVELDQHLKRGTKSDAMVRIYFHYDEASQVVVVGSMPGHLDNFLTN